MNLRRYIPRGVAVVGLLGVQLVALWQHGCSSNNFGLSTTSASSSTSSTSTTSSSSGDAEPSCTDMAKNGTETDVDCGGSCATKCAIDRGCAMGADCQSTFCRAMKCFAGPAASVFVGENSFTACANAADGRLKCWGDNRQSQMGDGTSTSPRSTPLLVNVGTGRAVYSMALGTAHSCALLEDGSVKCWGRNTYGELGIGNMTNATSPPATGITFPGGATARSITAGDAHSCAVLSDDKLVCWGNNQFSQIGDGTTADKTSPTVINLGTGRAARSAGTGGSHSCAVLDDNSVKCWGDNSFGQLGNGTLSPVTAPGATVNLGAGRTALAVALGELHTCVLRDNRSVVCFGNNGDGRLGNGNTTQSAIPVDVNLGVGRTALSISAGAEHNCAVLDNETLACWGSNIFGRLGDTTQTARTSPVIINVGAGRKVARVGAGRQQTCAALDDKSVKCWGDNSFGQLGDGTMNGATSPGSAITLGF